MALKYVQWVEQLSGLVHNVVKLGVTAPEFNVADIFVYGAFHGTEKTTVLADTNETCALSTKRREAGFISPQR